MDIKIPTSPFSALVNVVLGLVVVALVALFVWWFFVRPGQEHRAAVVTGVQSQYTNGMLASTHEATNTVTNVLGQDTQVQQRVQQGNEQIMATNGATIVVPDDSQCAGLRALCMSNTYHNTTQCTTLQQSCPR